MDKHVRKARSLSRLAKRPGSEAEGETATRILKEFLRKHDIDPEALAGDDEIPEQVADAVIDIGRHQFKERGLLVANLVKVFACEAILATRRHRVHVFGFGRSLEMAVTVSRFLLPQLEFALAGYQISWYQRIVPFLASLRRREFVVGWSESALQVVRNFYAGEATSGFSTSRNAIALRDRAALVRAHIDSRYHDLRTIKITYKGPGYHAGRAEGRNADVAATRLEGAGPKQLGT